MVGHGFFSAAGIAYEVAQILFSKETSSIPPSSLCKSARADIGVFSPLCHGNFWLPTTSIACIAHEVENTFPNPPSRFWLLFRKEVADSIAFLTASSWGKRANTWTAAAVI